MSSLVKILTARAPGAHKRASGLLTLFLFLFLSVAYLALPFLATSWFVAFLQPLSLQILSLLTLHVYFSATASKTFIESVALTVNGIVKFFTNAFRMSDSKANHFLLAVGCVLALDVIFLLLKTSFSVTFFVAVLPIVVAGAFQLISPISDLSSSNVFSDKLPYSVVSSNLLAMICSNRELLVYTPSDLKEKRDPKAYARQASPEKQKDFLSVFAARVTEAPICKNTETRKEFMAWQFEGLRFESREEKRSLLQAAEEKLNSLGNPIRSVSNKSLAKMLGDAKKYPPIVGEFEKIENLISYIELNKVCPDATFKNHIS